MRGRGGAKGMRIIGVTVLTSLNGQDLAEMADNRLRTVAAAVSERPDQGFLAEGSNSKGKRIRGRQY